KAYPDAPAGSGSGVLVDDQHGAWRMRRNFAGHASGENAGQAVLPVGAQHDQAGSLLVGYVGDALPRGRRVHSHALGVKSRGLGQRGSVRGCLLRRFAHLVGGGGVELAPLHRDEPHVEGPPHGEHHRLAARHQLAPRDLDRVFGEVGTVVGEQDGAQLVAHGGASAALAAWRSAECESPSCAPTAHASGSVRTWSCEMSRTPASSGGESQAGASPLIHVSSDGDGGTTRPSAYNETASSVPPAVIPKQIHSATRVPAAGVPPTVAATCTRTGATMNAATARRSSMIANTRCKALLRSEKPAMKRAGATEPPTPRPISPDATAMTKPVGGSPERRIRIPAISETMPPRTR